jgi:hypothetical protein
LTVGYTAAGKSPPGDPWKPRPAGMLMQSRDRGLDGRVVWSVLRSASLSKRTAGRQPHSRLLKANEQRWAGWPRLSVLLAREQDERGKFSAPKLMHTHSASRPWRPAPSTPWETDHLARATRCVDLAVAAPAGTPGEPTDTRSGRSQPCPQHQLHRQRLILLYGGATTVVPRNRSCGEERCFHSPCPVDSPYA